MNHELDVVAAALPPRFGETLGFPLAVIHAVSLYPTFAISLRPGWLWSPDGRWCQRRVGSWLYFGSDLDTDIQKKFII